MSARLGGSIIANRERTLHMCDTNRARPISARPKGTNLMRVSKIIKFRATIAQFTEPNDVVRVIGFNGLCEFLFCDSFEFLCGLQSSSQGTTAAREKVFFAPLSAP